MCSLTSTQLAELLNYLLGVNSFHRLIVETWVVRKERLQIEHWCQAVLEDSGLIKFPYWNGGRRSSLVPPEAVMRFASEEDLEKLLEREKARARRVA